MVREEGEERGRERSYLPRWRNFATLWRLSSFMSSRTARSVPVIWDYICDLGLCSSVLVSLPSLISQDQVYYSLAHERRF